MLGWGLERANPIRPIAGLLFDRFLENLSQIGTDGSTQLIQHGPWIMENILDLNLEIQFCIHLGLSFHARIEMLFFFFFCPHMDVKIF